MRSIQMICLLAAVGFLCSCNGGSGKGGGGGGGGGGQRGFTSDFETPLSSISAQTAYSPGVTIRPQSGDAVIVWVESHDGVQKAVYNRLLSANSSLDWSVDQDPGEFQLPDFSAELTASSVYKVALVADASDAVTALWQVDKSSRVITSRLTGSWDAVHHWSETGARKTSVISVGPTTYLIWEEGGKLYFTQRESSTWLPALEPAGDGLLDASIAGTRNGEVTVAWVQARQIHSKHFDGKAWSAIQNLVITNGTDSHESPLIHMNEKGDEVITGHLLDGVNTLFYKVFASRRMGDAWETPVIMETYKCRQKPSVYGSAMDADGYILMLMSQCIGALGLEDNLVISRYHPDSGWLNASGLLIDSDTTFNDPRLAMNPSGNAIAVWSGHKVGTEGNDRIWARRMNSDVGEGPLTPLTDGSVHASKPQVAINEQGAAVVVWQESNSDGESMVKGAVLVP